MFGACSCLVESPSLHILLFANSCYTNNRKQPKRRLGGSTSQSSRLCSLAVALRGRARVCIQRYCCRCFPRIMSAPSRSQRYTRPALGTRVASQRGGGEGSGCMGSARSGVIVCVSTLSQSLSVCVCLVVMPFLLTCCSLFNHLVFTEFLMVLILCSLVGCSLVVH